MVKRLYPSSPILAASVAIWRGDKVLLVSRSKPPNAQRWALPGGVVEVGETLETAAKREVVEETSLIVGNLQFLQFHEVIEADRTGRTERHYVLAVFAGTADTGTAIAGDDAADIGWFKQTDLPSLSMTGKSEDLIKASWDLLNG